MNLSGFSVFDQSIFLRNNSLISFQPVVSQYRNKVEFTIGVGPDGKGYLCSLSIFAMT